MAISVPSSRLVLMVMAMAAVSVMPVVYGQIGTPCTAANIASFSPCMNFLTNSTANGTGSTAPTADCCNSLKNLTSTSRDCVCLIVTGSIPIQLPINRTLAISLPRACNTPGVPLQCKTSGAPLPAPGPNFQAPTSSPGASPSAGPTASTVPEPTSSAESPESNTTPSSTGVSEAPTATTGSRPVLTPSGSGAMPSYALSPSLLLFASAVLVLKFC